MGDTIGEWKQREAPRLFKFTQKGQKLEGVLCGRERITIAGKPVVRYTFRHESGEFCTLLGTADIITKLRKDDIGHLVRIEFYGEDADVSKNGNAMRIFNIQVFSAKAADFMPNTPAGDGTEITDDDIPF